MRNDRQAGAQGPLRNTDNPDDADESAAGIFVEARPAIDLLDESVGPMDPANLDTYARWYADQLAQFSRGGRAASATGVVSREWVLGESPAQRVNFTLGHPGDDYTEQAVMVLALVDGTAITATAITLEDEHLPDIEAVIDSLCLIAPRP